MNKILLILFLIILFVLIDRYIYEDFIIMPFNMATRYYPTYDIRGYPYIPYIKNFFISLSPYYYMADGSYKKIY